MTGVRPHESRAQTIPSSVSIISEREPLIFAWALRIPSTIESFWMMSSPTNSVGFTFPDENSERCMSLWRISVANSSRFAILPTVESAKRPRWELNSSGCASVSEMIPIPALPINRGNSSSIFARKEACEMEWITLLKVPEEAS